MPGIASPRRCEFNVARHLSALLLITASSLACAGSPHLALDINSQYTAIDSSPVWLGKMGGSFYFIAHPVPTTAAGGDALFKTDGTAAGTSLVAPIDGPGVMTNQPGPLFVSAGTKAYFLAFTTAAAQEVWVTDGTASGTHMVVDLSLSQSGTSPRLLGLIGTDLIFAEAPTDNTLQLYRTDGTAAGTHPLSNFAQLQYGRVTDSVAVNGKVYVALDSGLICCQPDLWVTDGSSGGTRQIDSNEGTPWHLIPSSLRAFGNAVALLTDTENLGAEPSFIDTSTDALTVLDTVSGAGSGADYGSTVAAMDGFVLYLNDVSNHFSLWRTDGTLAGTTMVKDFGPGNQVSQLSVNITMTRVGSRAIFQAESAQDGPQLWSSDGTLQGTVPLIATPTPAGYVEPLIGVAGTHGYYAVYRGSDYRVVVTDGTLAGTHVLTGAGPLDSNGLSGFGQATSTRVAGDDTLAYINTYYFDTVSGNVSHLSAYAPQTNGLVHLLDTPDGGGNDPLLADAGRLYFRARDPTHGGEPWVSNGTVAGTQMLLDIAQEIVTNDSNPSYLTDVNGTLYFAADDGVHGTELWKSDGTASGTTLAVDVTSGAIGSNPTQLTNWNGSLYFFTSLDPYAGAFMRTTDSLSNVTTLGSIFPEPRPMDPNFLSTGCYDPRAVPFSGKLFFGAGDGSGFKLWSTDGTAGGTQSIGTGFTGPCNLTVFNGRLYFRGISNSGAGYQLFSTDGTAAGTAALLTGAAFVQLSGGDFFVFDNLLFFSATDANNVSGVYCTDGTAAGTRLLKAGSAPGTSFIPVGVSNGRLVSTNTVYLPGSTNQELWVSDGTSTGTVQLSGVQVALNTPLLATSKYFYFMNSDSNGVHPWVSDGTAAGTHLLADVNPGGDSDIRWFVDFHGVVYFATNDSANGARIWKTDGTTPRTVVVGGSALPRPLGNVQVSGQNLFFAGDDGRTGLELNVLQNNAPQAVNDSANSTDDAAVTIDVVSNDTDSDGTIDPTRVKIASQPSHGSASVSPSGSVVYTPSAGYAGSDSFAYTDEDNQGASSNAATVTITVTAAKTSSSGGGNSGGGSGGGGGGGGGGGALNLFELLALAGLAVLRRRNAPRAFWFPSAEARECSFPLQEANRALE